jgi:hypothetical protein
MIIKGSFSVELVSVGPIRLKVSNLQKREYPMSTGGGTNVSFQIQDDLKFTVTIETDDAAGNPTQKGFDSSTVVFSTSDDTVLTVQSAADNLSADVVPTGKLGTAQVSVKATLNGSDVTGSLDVEVVAGNAATIHLKPDNIQPK